MRRITGSIYMATSGFPADFSSITILTFLWAVNRSKFSSIVQVHSDLSNVGWARTSMSFLITENITALDTHEISARWTGLTRWVTLAHWIMLSSSIHMASQDVIESRLLLWRSRGGDDHSTYAVCNPEVQFCGRRYNASEYLQINAKVKRKIYQSNYQLYKYKSLSIHIAFNNIYSI